MVDEALERQEGEVTRFTRFLPLLRMIKAYILAIGAALALSFSWFIPGSDTAVILGWCASLSLLLLIRTRTRRYLPAFACGVLVNIFGFYWLFPTIKTFGGFPPEVAGLLFGLFVIISALQIVLFVLFHNHLPAFFHRSATATATAWVLAECLSVRIFPWYLGHTQLGFTTFVQIADIGGATLISFLMLWFTESLFRVIILREPNRFIAIPILLFGGCLAYGAQRTHTFSDGKLNGIRQKVAVVQANIALSEKHDPRAYADNTKKHLELAKSLHKPDTLIIWPETAIMQFIPAGAYARTLDPELKKLPAGIPMLVGALTYDSSEKIYNSAIAIRADGSIPYPYHKRVLMPFGEYTPGTTDDMLSKILPASVKEWLRATNANVGNLGAGVAPAVFQYIFAPADGQGARYTLEVSPLICYEDVIPGPARESVAAGAELLVNLTNDSWFGETVAPLQHNAVAAFRSIENRRYLIRSTNSGVTSIISPLGKTVSQLAPFTPGTLLADVKLLSYKSIYTRFNGERWTHILLIIALLSTLTSKLKGRGRSS